MGWGPEAVIYTTQVPFITVITRNRFETWRKQLNRKKTNNKRREKKEEERQSMWRVRAPRISRFLRPPRSPTLGSYADSEHFSNDCLFGLSWFMIHLMLKKTNKQQKKNKNINNYTRCLKSSQIKTISPI